MCNYCKQEGHVIADCPMFARCVRGKPGGSRGGPGSGSAYATIAIESTESSSLTFADVRRLVQDALKEALPNALTSAFAMGKDSSSGSCHVDSATYNHMTSSHSAFRSLDMSVSCLGLQAANGSIMSIVVVGHVAQPHMSLPNTLYVPKLAPNLVSLGQLADGGCPVIFDNTGCILQDTRTGKKIR
ncbi:unnamed protein product [Linum trigynum]|uniref:CCHC-type domain-containing protein n=1 Tax=Linum trigynum TaxID=586398 RepID=A0AAV2GK13_9ROSI